MPLRRRNQSCVTSDVEDDFAGAALLVLNHITMCLSCRRQRQLGRDDRLQEPRKHTGLQQRRHLSILLLQRQQTPPTSPVLPTGGSA